MAPRSLRTRESLRARRTSSPRGSLSESSGAPFALSQLFRSSLYVDALNVVRAAFEDWVTLFLLLDARVA